MTEKYLINGELSIREVQVVRLLSLGKSNSEIGREMHVSANTVKTHVSAAGKKLGIGTRAGIVGECFRRGIIRLEDS